MGAARSWSFESSTGYAATCPFNAKLVRALMKLGCRSSLLNLPSGNSRSGVWNDGKRVG